MIPCKLVLLSFPSQNVVAAVAITYLKTIERQRLKRKRKSITLFIFPDEQRVLDSHYLKAVKLFITDVILFMIDF